MKYLLILSMVLLGACSTIPVSDGIAKIAVEGATHHALNEGYDLTGYTATGVCQIANMSECTGNSEFGELLNLRLNWIVDQSLAGKNKLPAALFRHQSVDSDNINRWIQATIVSRE